MADIRDYETRTSTTYKLDIGGFVDELVREKLEEVLNEQIKTKELSIDYYTITAKIVYSYLLFHCLHPKGSVEEFIHNNTHMDEIKKTMDKHIRFK